MSRPGSAASVASAGSSASVASTRPESSISNRRPQSNAENRPASANSQRPPSAGSTRPKSSAAQRPQSAPRQQPPVVGGAPLPVKNDRGQADHGRPEPPEEVSCCAKFLRFTLSTIGLLCVIMAYLVGGGFLFQVFELKLEKERKLDKLDLIADIERTIDNTTFNLWVKIHELETGHLAADKETWLSEGNTVIWEWGKQILTCVHEYKCEALAVKVNGRYNGSMLAEEGIYDWSVPNSILYAATAVTTIGYGHIATRSLEGRLITIVYSILGLPLMLMCLANIGDVMADAIRYVYSRCCCFCCNRRRRQNHYLYRVNEEKFGGDVYRGPLTVAQGEAVNKELLDELDEELDLQLQETTVPISLTLVIISMYCFLGAAIFAAWEQWSLIVGGYFSFVTLATIGFGDYVPGATSFTSDSQIKMIVSTVYILLGLAVISMSFSLMQEEMAMKFRWIGRKLGIVDDEDEFEEEGMMHRKSKKAYLRLRGGRSKRLEHLKKARAAKAKQAVHLSEDEELPTDFDARFQRAPQFSDPYANGPKKSENLLIPSTYRPPVIPGGGSDSPEPQKAEAAKKNKRRNKRGDDTDSGSDGEVDTGRGNNSSSSSSDSSDNEE